MRAATQTMAGTLRECNRRAAPPARLGKASAVRTTPAGRGAMTDTDESDES